MLILVIGGTRFLGRHLVEAALERNHNLTLFNRGRTNADQATLHWNAARPEGFTGRAGIIREREAALLEQWNAQLRK